MVEQYHDAIYFTILIFYYFNKYNALKFIYFLA